MTSSFETTASPEQTTLVEQMTSEIMDLSTEDIGTIQTTVSLDQFSTIENNQTFTSISSEGPGKLNFTDVYVSTVYPNEEDTNCFERFITSWQGIGMGSR